MVRQFLVWMISACLAASGPAWAAQADTPTVGARYLSVGLARKAVQAALDDCLKDGYQVAVALTDRSGNLQAFMRDPLAGAHTIDVSRRKAFAAASFQADTLGLQGNPGMQPLNTSPGVLLLGGGVPIRVGGHFYGGIGVSGAPAQKVTGDIDDRCARAGIEAIREDLEFGE